MFGQVTARPAHHRRELPVAVSELLAPPVAAPELPAQPGSGPRREQVPEPESHLGREPESHLAPERHRELVRHRERVR